MRFDIQPETLDTLVPNLILQPLVENAIKHGVAEKVRARPHRHLAPAATATSCWMEVRDDGVGLSEDALTALQKGIGVSTTRARLQHLFGADFRFEFHRQTPGCRWSSPFPWRIEPCAAGGRADSAARRRSNARCSHVPADRRDQESSPSDGSHGPQWHRSPTPSPQPA